ncbi:hypothetical protein [Pedobacter rhodius]|uniref:Lipoprotein n=1 Tax=Pedobacter rhodius TaxID=3004098 RepID=A0ABT4KYN1_9SPHI|nr:hypothetical protein [Pedobacter sp. SJ11]MCZ4224045.1 hypothetical protein [Pedobacter sp. SJ11]
MKKLITVMVIAAIFMACSNPKKPQDTTKVAKEQSTEGLTDKEKLIAELNRFKLAVQTKDKNEITGFFIFPVADSALTVYDMGDEFDKQKVENGNAITKKMFIDNFNSLYSYLDFDEFSNLFRYLKINEITTRNSLSYEHKPKNEGCYYTYHIDVKNTEVTISYGTNTNDEYFKKHSDEAEVCSEYLSIWVFDWNGKKLVFKKQMVAG